LRLAPPEGSCSLITTEHDQSAFSSLTTGAGRSHTGLKMRTYVEIGRDRMRAAYRFEDQVLGRLDGVRVVDARVKDPERVHAKGPCELVHDVELAPTGSCLGRSPVQRIPAGSRAVDGHQNRPRVLS
jgi:hypothetical protein